MLKSVKIKLIELMAKFISLKAYNIKQGKMWHYLRKFLKLLGGKVMSKMAPRLFFQQFYKHNRLDLEQKKKRYKLHHLSPAAILIYHRFLKNPKQKLGFSTLLEQPSSNADSIEINAIQVNDSQIFWDDKTISSTFEGDINLDADFEFIQVENDFVRD